MDLQKLLLNRKHVKEIDKVLNMMGRVVDEYVNQGMVIYCKITDEYEFNEYQVPIMASYMQLFDLFDSIGILTKKGQSEGIKPILRALFETTLTFEHLINSSIEAGVIAYQVAHAYKEMKLRKLLDPSTDSGKKFKGNIQKEFPGIDLPAYSIDETTQHLRKFLDREEVIPVNDRWIEVSTKMKNRHPEWYSLYSSASNLRELSRMYNKELAYDLIYPELSGASHATGLVKNVKAKDGVGVLPGLRRIEDVQHLLTYALDFVDDSISQAINKYIPYFKEEHYSWYITNVQNEVDRIFSEVPMLSVSYTPVMPRTNLCSKQQ